MQCDYFYPHHCPIPSIHSFPTTPFPTTMPFSFAFKQWVLPGNLYHHLSGSPFIYKDSVLFLSLSPTHRQLSKVWEFKMFWVKFCCWFLLVHISAFIYKSLGVCVFVSVYVCLCVLACVHISVCDTVTHMTWCACASSVVCSHLTLTDVCLGPWLYKVTRYLNYSSQCLYNKYFYLLIHLASSWLLCFSWSCFLYLIDFFPEIKFYSKCRTRYFIP